MVLPLSEFFTSGSQTCPARRPLFTSIPNSWNFQSVDRLSRIGGDFKNFWRMFRESPELVATISIPITDVLGDRPTWVAPDGSALGRNKLMDARKFWRNNRGKETLKAALFDAFLTGDFYIWKGFPQTSQVLKAVKEVVEKNKYALQRFQLKELMVKSAQDEDLKKPKKIDYVAAATVKIIHDEFEIKGYEQSTNGKIARFLPDEIVHWRYLTLNGSVKGFSPVEALTAEIFLIQLVKRNMTSLMRNGGSPDKMFILPKEIANSRNHEYLISQLRKYKKVDNWHGNLVFTGDVDVKDLQGTAKDLEYKDLALYITSNIAFIYSIPITRIPYLIGSSASKGDSGGLSEAGYWNFISSIQDDLEDLLNSQVFESLGWHIKFQRKYKQDEVREAQTRSMNADTITKYQSILSKAKKKLTSKKTLELLDFAQEDIEDFSPEDLELMNDSMNQNMLGKGELNSEQDKLAKNQTKRNVANQKGSKEAVSQA